MDDQLNNDLKNRINEVFDQFEAPEGAPASGWTELRKVYPSRQKRRLAPLWWSSAAAILMLLLFSIWLYKPSNPKPTTYTKIKQPAHVPAKTQGNVVQPPLSQLPGSKSPLPQQQLMANAVTRPDKKYPVNTRNNKTRAASVQKDETPFTGYAATPGGISSSSPVSSYPAITAQAVVPVVKKQPSVIDSASKGITQPTATLANSYAPVNSKRDSLTHKKPPGSMEEVFAREASLNKLLKEDHPQNTDKAVSFSVYAGTYLSYAKGSSNQLNAGAGVTSDIKLARRIKLVTGVAIGQNSLSYNGQPAMPGAYAIAQAAVERKTIAANSPNTVNLTSTLYPASINRITGYSASLTGLDIPVNIKYELGTQKTSTYILAGVSSGTFINESYNYSYVNASQYNTSQSAGTQTRFNGFDFAHTLNVAFGIGTPMGKSNRLFIEPFLKYPIGNAGSQQLRFGAGGVNLKFNLLSHK